MIWLFDHGYYQYYIIMFGAAMYIPVAIVYRLDSSSFDHIKPIVVYNNNNNNDDNVDDNIG